MLCVAWRPLSNGVTKLSRVFQPRLPLRTMPHRTTFNPTRGVNPSPRPQPIASMRLLESRVQLENVDIDWFSYIVEDMA